MLGLLALVLALAVPPVEADITVIEARIDTFYDLTFTAADFDVDCNDEADFEVIEAGAGFRFFETDPPSQQGLGSEPGYFATGCGTVTKEVPVPPGLRMVTLHFEAQRNVETYHPQLQADAELHQWLDLLDAQGRSVHGPHPVFPSDAPTQDLQSIGPIEFVTGNDRLGDTMSVLWTFRDDGLAQSSGPVNPLSGQAFGASVRNVVVQMTSLVPVDGYLVASEQSRDGTLLTTEHRVSMTLDEGFGATDAPAISVRIAPGNDFYGVIVPDGTLLRDVSTHDSEEVLGYEQTQSTLQITGSYTQVTFPRTLVAAHGPGEYAFVFRDTGGIQVSPGLVPVAGILLIAPLPFAVLAWLESRAFRKEAFGRYAASARNLQWGVAMVFAYYTVVVLSAAAGGRIALMAVWPLSLEAWLLYAQVVLAGIAFTGLWLVARELFLIVRPPRSQVEGARPDGDWADEP